MDSADARVAARERERIERKMHDGRDLVAGRGRVSTKSRPSRHGQELTGGSGLARDDPTIAPLARSSKRARANVSPRKQMVTAEARCAAGRKRWTRLIFLDMSKVMDATRRPNHTEDAKW